MKNEDPRTDIEQCQDEIKRFEDMLVRLKAKELTKVQGVLMDDAEIERLRDILGSLMVSQFKSQNEYQDAINQIIYHFFNDLTKAGIHWKKLKQVLNKSEDNDKPCDTE